MVKTLSAGAIGISAATLTEGLAAAKSVGFEGLEFNPAEVALLGPAQVEDMFEAAGVNPAGFGLPVNWRQDEDTWRGDLANLPELARAAAGIGCTRCATWVLPGSNDRELAENVAWHVERFRPIAEILADNGISLGLEFIGPKTLRDQFRYPFVWTAQDMLDVAAQIGPNVGLLHDCWHWYTSGGTLEELRALRPEQIVYVHINDAPEGIAVDEQVDNDRRLPAQTGVIDIAGYLRTLNEIGYEGPVVAEPFYAPLGGMASDEERLRTVKDAIDRAFAQAGL